MEISSNNEVIVQLLEGKMLTSVKEVIRSLGLTDNFKLHLSKCCPEGVNFMATLYRVVATNEEKIDQKIKLILKYSTQETKFRDKAKFREYFEREVYVYEKILPEFETFQKIKNIPESEVFKFPTCYKTCLELKNEFIVLEDLGNLNFKMKDCKDHLNFSHCKIIINQLAKFHAISFAYKDQYPDKFKALTEHCTYKYVLEFNSLTEESKRQLQKFYNETALKILNEEKLYHKKLQQILDTKGSGIFVPVVNRDEKYQNLCHCDFWISNILFQYQQDDYDEKTPQDVRFLDFQCVSLYSPIADLSYVIYGNTTEETRKLYFDALLKLYYDSLANYLKKLGSDPKIVYPYTAYQENIKMYFKYGIVRLIAKLFDLKNHMENESSQLDCDDKKNEFSDSIFKKNYYWCMSALKTSLKHALDNGLI